MTFWKAFGAQLRRDLTEWWTLWAAAVAAGLVPLLLPVLYSARGEEALDLRVAALAVGGGLYWLASVALLGDGLAARDLGEGRLAFFLTRPMAIRAFWPARVAAALLLMAAITVSLLLPSFLAQPGDVAANDPALNPWLMSTTAPGLDVETLSPLSAGGAASGFLKVLAPVGLAAGMVCLLLLAHLVGTAGRSRDVWTLLDLVGLLVVAVLLLATREVLLSAHAFAVLVAAERVFVAAAACVLLVAGARQLGHGRIDLARGHGAFSRTAWPLLAAVALVVLVGARWVANPAPEDLVSAEQVVATSDGRHALVTGLAAHRLGLRTGVVFSEDGAAVVSGPVATAAAGSESAGASAAKAEHLAWTRCRRLYDLDCEIWTWSAADPQPRATGISSDRWSHQLAWSPHGELLALTHSRIEVWKPGGDSPRLVYSLDPGDGYPAWPAFPSADRLRFLFLEPDHDVIRLEEVDLPSRTVRTVGEMPGESPLHLVTSPSARFVFAVSMIPSHISLLDTETGYVATLETLPGLAGQTLVGARFLGDQSLYLLLAESAGGSWRLLRIDLDQMRDGEIVPADVALPPLRPLGPETQGRLGVRAGKILLSAAVDSDGASSIVLPEGVEPLPNQSLWVLDDGSWTRGIDGVRILYVLVDTAAQRDTSTLVAGGGAVLRLGEDDAGVLSLGLVVPALPETQPGRPFAD